jgi:UDP-N-acetyl-D-mannosaminuronate dehydrogenase/predicted transcriptional regulator
MNIDTYDDILILILDAARNGETKTNLMYKSFISFELLGEYLSEAMKKGLIENEKGRTIFKTTPEGIKYIETHNTKKHTLGHAIILTRYQKVLIIGLGQLGLPVAKYVRQRGFDTYGYDISEMALERAENNGIKKATDFKDFDVYILCVSTHKPEDMFLPQVDGLMSIADRISHEAKNGALVVIESTIPKGTSRKIFERLDHRLHVAHAPHRWYVHEEESHGVNQLRVLGGVHDCCLNAAMQFYDGRSENINRIEQQQLSSQSFPELIKVNQNASLGIPMHPVSEVEYAELTKIVENAHRYLQIAFAEELYLYCADNNLNFAELREALNTKWNVEILEPRDGIGGHCLPKDTKMFIQSSNRMKSKILQAAMEVDNDYRKKRQSQSQRNSAQVNVVNA